MGLTRGRDGAREPAGRSRSRERARRRRTGHRITAHDGITAHRRVTGSRWRPGWDRPERAERFAAISINGVRPTVVTTTTGPTVVVEGTVANTGNRLLRSLSIRLQRGQPARRAADLRAELAADPATFEVNGDFHHRRDVGSGRDHRFLPSSTAERSRRPADIRAWRLPLLVNLNATPDYGAQARVADSRTLLPVLSLPPDAERARLFAEHPDAMPGLGPDGSVAANTSRPAAFTLLWPLAAPPQAVPGRVGAGTTDQIVLVNDNLSRSLAGRSPARPPEGACTR